jgi:sigma-E factor negative regulatory protein RseC
VIEERAVVSRVEDGRVWVRPFGVESCARCREGRGCGGGVIGRLVSRRRPDVPVQLRQALPRVGDVVIVGVEEQALMQAALAVYALPILTLLLAGGFAHQVLQAHELLVAAFGALGLIGGFVLTHRVGQSMALRPGFSPALLRPAPTDGDCGRA